MRTIHTRLATLGLTIALAALGACGNKKADPGGAGVGSGSSAAAAAPAKCPPGNVIKDGACVVVVTAEQVAAVGRQQSRIDDLAKLLDQVEPVAAVIDLFDGIRQLDQWKALKDKSAKFAALDAVADTLKRARLTLGAFRLGLDKTSARLADLRGELDGLMTATGAARQLADARAAVSSKLNVVVTLLSAQVADVVQEAITPLTTQLADLSDLVIGGCAMAKLSGGGDKLKELCAQARDVFAKATTFVDSVKARPAQLFTDVASQLTAQLDQLVDAETRQLVTAAQAKVNDLLKLPAPAAGSGSAGSGSAGSGSAGSGSAGSGSAGSAK